MIEIREFEDGDYQGVVGVLHAATPEYPTDSDSLRNADLKRDPICKHARWVAVMDDEIVGYAQYTQHIDIYHPRKYYVTVCVRPSYQKRGIGSTLYKTMFGVVAAHDPLELRSSVREDRPDALQFALNRGYDETSRRWTSRLDLATLNPDRFQARLEKVAAQGIVLRSVRSLADDPERDEKLLKLQTEVDEDVPFPDTLTPLTLEQFRARVLNDPGFNQDVSIVAVDGSTYAGLTLVFGYSGGRMDIDLSGTSRSYRRRGITTAIKLRSIMTAHELGFREMITTNDPVNSGILAINQQLGFVRDPAEIGLTACPSS